MSDSKEHFDLEPIEDRPREEAKGPSGPAPSPPGQAATPVPPSPADAKPLLELEEDVCPKCQSPLTPDAVFCVKCGYDLRTNETRTPRLGVEHVAEKPKEEPNEFSLPGRGKVPVLLAIGGVITVGAMVVAGLNAPPHFGPVLARVILCLYETALHTGTGLIAVLIAARLVEQKPGNLELALARVFVAFSTFQLLHQITFTDYRVLSALLMYPLGLAAYWGLVMLLFRKPRMVALMVVLVHVVLWLVVQIGVGLSNYASAQSVQSATAAEKG